MDGQRSHIELDIPTAARSQGTGRLASPLDDARIRILRSKYYSLNQMTILRNQFCELT